MDTEDWVWHSTRADTRGAKYRHHNRVRNLLIRIFHVTRELIIANNNVDYIASAVLHSDGIRGYLLKVDSVKGITARGGFIPGAFKNRLTLQWYLYWRVAPTKGDSEVPNFGIANRVRATMDVNTKPCLNKEKCIVCSRSRAHVIQEVKLDIIAIISRGTCPQKHNIIWASEIYVLLDVQMKLTADSYDSLKFVGFIHLGRANECEVA